MGGHSNRNRVVSVARLCSRAYVQNGGRLVRKVGTFVNRNDFLKKEETKKPFS